MNVCFLELHRGKDPIWVNMATATHFSTDGGTGTVICFPTAVGDEQSYVCVTETPGTVASRLKAAFT